MFFYIEFHILTFPYSDISGLTKTGRRENNTKETSVMKAEDELVTSLSEQSA